MITPTLGLLLCTPLCVDAVCLLTWCVSVCEPLSLLVVVVPCFSVRSPHASLCLCGCVVVWCDYFCPRTSVWLCVPRCVPPASCVLVFVFVIVVVQNRLFFRLPYLLLSCRLRSSLTWLSLARPPQVINVDDDGNELGSGVMELTDAELVLHTHRRDDVRWPYLCLRRYGYDSNLFSFESGRRCQTGQGTNCCTVVLFVATYRERAEVRTLKLPYN